MGGMGMPYGLQAMLKDGHKHLSGLEEAIFKNIEACKQLSQITKTSMGPNGMNKMVVNHLDKLFVTSDASTIVNELEVEHPAAKLLVLAAQAQQQEIGDGTNFVITFAGELLGNAEALLQDGLHTSEVAEGYTKAAAKALCILETLVHPDSTKIDVRNTEQVVARMKAAVCSKQFGYEDLLCGLVAQACINVCPANPASFNVDNVRVVKIPGGGPSDSSVVQGMVVKRGTEGAVQSVAEAKVAVFAQGVDTASTETKGTVLIHSAAELEGYSRGEEDRLEALIRDIADSGAKVVVAGSAIGEMAMHFIDKFGMMALRIPSKFDLRRFCRATGATALAKLGRPGAEELGHASWLGVEEIGGTNVVTLKQSGAAGAVATILLRASTEQLLEDLERAVDDGVNTYKALCRDARTVAAGGAVEVEIARQLSEAASKETGLEQYAITKFAEALEVVPRTVAANSGLNATEAVAALAAAHAGGNGPHLGLDVDGGPPKDLAKEGYADLYLTKWWALKLAAEAATTVLRVDQIIMAKQAGGPKPREPGAADEE